MKPTAILIVEPAPDSLALILKGVALGQDEVAQAVTTSLSAEDALRQLNQFDADYDILIIGPTWSDSYCSLCRETRREHDSLHVVCVLKDYDSLLHRQVISAGANDVVSVDRLPGGLELRLLPIRSAIERHNRVQEQLSYAQQTAFMAMSSMGELSPILEFLRKSFQCSEAVILANLLLDALEQYELKSIVRVSALGSSHVFSRSGQGQPSEVSIVEHAMTMGRIFEFGDRAAFNFMKVSVVVSGIPRDDPDRRGRLRDNLALLIEAADFKAIAMELDLLAQQRAKAIHAAQQGVFANLRFARSIQENQNNQAIATVQQFKKHMEKLLLSLGLTEAQEDDVMNSLSYYSDLLINLHKQDIPVLEGLEDLASMINETYRAL